MAISLAGSCGEAALRMRDAINGLNIISFSNIGTHEGPCLAVVLNERQDYFGQTVNIAARVQGLATARSIFLLDKSGHSGALQFLDSNHIRASAIYALCGIAEKVTVFDILSVPGRAPLLRLLRKAVEPPAKFLGFERFHKRHASTGSAHS